MTTLSFLLSDTAADGRLARKRAYRANTVDLIDLRYVAHIEKHDGVFVEMDAEDYDHACRVAQHVVDHWTGVASVAVRRVRGNGHLSRATRIFDGMMDQASYVEPV